MKKYKEIINEVNHELTKYEEIVKKRDINKGYEEYINIPLLVNKTNIYKLLRPVYLAGMLFKQGDNYIFLFPYSFCSV